MSSSDLHRDRVLLAPDGCTRYRASSIRPRTGCDVLGVWAHPDDESYLSAGLMARTVQAGGRVTLVTLTDGEGGFPDDDVRPTQERSRLRRNELIAAMNRIGVTDIRFLGIADGRVARDGGDELVSVLRETICSVQPDVVVTFGPDGITGHDDHVATWQAVTRAWLDAGRGDLHYAVHTRDWLDEWREVHDEIGIWMTGEPDGIDSADAAVQLELSGEELGRKLHVLRAHASQTAGIVAALGEDVYRSWIRRETFRRPTSSDLAAAVEHVRAERPMVAGLGS